MRELDSDRMRVQDRVATAAARTRAAIKDLEVSLRAVVEAAGSGGQGMLDEALAAGAAELLRTDLDASARKLAETLDDAAGDLALDAVEQGWRAHAALRRALASWPQAGMDPAQASRKALASLAALTEARREIAFVCIASEVRERLRYANVGTALDVEPLVAADVPEPEDRRKLIARLADDRAGDDWVVDVPRGRVYRKSPSRLVRVASWFAFPLFALLGAAALCVLSVLDLPADLRLTDTGAVVEAYVWVVAGSLLHLLIENIKQGQAGVGVLAIGTFFDWLHVRWQALASGFVPIVVVVVSLRTAGVDTEADDVAAWLAAGYSADSLAGVVLTRFDTRIRALVPGVQRRLTGMPAP